MLIAVNTRFLIKDKLEGIGWFTYETMKRLTRNHPEHTFLFLFDRDWEPEFIFSDNIIPLKVWPPARHPYLWKYWFDYALPQIFKKYKPDVFISTDGFLSLKTHVPTLLVIHDLGFEHYPDHTPGIVSKYYRKFTPLYAKKATRIITVSQFSKDDIVKHYHTDPKKIDVAHYFVYVGSVHPRKNVKNLLLAFDLLKKENATDQKLIIVGRLAWKTDETQAVFDNMQFKEDVIFTGHLQLNDLTRIVASADAFVFPSLFEGFGIPVLESRACGVPIITSNRSSLPEVAGKNALYFDPDNIDDIKNAMEEFLFNRKKYIPSPSDVQNVKQEFNWDKSSEIIYNAAMHCLKKSAKDSHVIVLN